MIFFIFEILVLLENTILQSKCIDTCEIREKKITAKVLFKDPLELRFETHM